MKGFIWFVVLVGLGFWLARLFRKSQILTTPNPPAFSSGGPGTSLDWGGAKS